MEEIEALIAAAVALNQEAADLIATSAATLTEEELTLIAGQIDTLQIDVVNNFANARIAIFNAGVEP